MAANLTKLVKLSSGKSFSGLNRFGQRKTVSVTYSYGMARRHIKRPANAPPPASGLYIEDWCAARGFGLQQLADKIGVSYQTVWRYQHNVRRPSLAKLRPVAAALGLQDVTDLQKPPSQANKTALLTGLSPDQKREVLNFIRFVRERDKPQP